MLLQRKEVLVRYLGLQSYVPVLEAMHQFTSIRNKDTLDEIWLVEHYPVFTCGKVSKNKTEHILIPSDIPVIQSDRGGQITYHGPGQQIMYVLLNLKRKNLSVRKLVTMLEQAVMDTLAKYNISANHRSNAPGVYVVEKKICSIGLCIRNGCSFHGLALNINMDLTPFLYINPCGYQNIEMTQMSHWIRHITPDIISPVLVNNFLSWFYNIF